ncbi:MAG: Cd(II)/Pb(II)-responsive transcriptional regulator [Zoogloeaceae bacterium]|jgi:Cd(II)/Pb(II)-responsive transcriptional regulator|nr:Cd(II)/Pb(II)-responsive transcriptional regulator [Zoogloeaceae bacterium]
MRIGELAKRARTQVETIRYYERVGLLPEAARTEGNYRVYGDRHVERLSFIRHCRELDMSLDEIRVLLRFADAPDASCAGVDALLEEHIAHVTHRIETLQNLKRQLQNLRKACPVAKDVRQCGILNELSAHAQKMPDTPAQHVGGTHGIRKGLSGSVKK